MVETKTPPAYHIPIKEWAEDDRPREKLMNKGIKTLSDVELLAILLRTGSKSESAVQLAQRILSQNDNNLNTLAKLNVNELKKYKGVGPTKAVTVNAALELGRRRKRSDIIHRSKINSSKDAFTVLLPLLNDLPHEEFWLLMLNRSNTIIKTELISRGGVSGTVADSKVIFKSSLENLASSIIVAHNHPSGNLTPSNEDIVLTEKLKAAAKLLDINLVDHLIVAENNFFSFADEGIL